MSLLDTATPIPTQGSTCRPGDVRQSDSVPSPLVVERLHAGHQVQDFDCGIREISQGLRDRAHDLRFQSAGRPWVAVDVDGTVVGYYVTVSSEIERRKAPGDLRGLEPAHPIPTTMVVAFAIDQRHQRQGYGADLMLHVFIKAAEAAELVTSYAIDLHAYDDRARAFYLRSGFQPLADPRRPDDLYILMSDVKTTHMGGRRQATCLKPRTARGRPGPVRRPTTRVWAGNCRPCPYTPLPGYGPAWAGMGHACDWCHRRAPLPVGRAVR